MTGYIGYFSVVVTKILWPKANNRIRSLFWLKSLEGESITVEKAGMAAGRDWVVTFHPHTGSRENRKWGKATNSQTPSRELYLPHQGTSTSYKFQVLSKLCLQLGTKYSKCEPIGSISHSDHHNEHGWVLINIWIDVEIHILSNFHISQSSLVFVFVFFRNWYSFLAQGHTQRPEDELMRERLLYSAGV